MTLAIADYVHELRAAPVKSRPVCPYVRGQSIPYTYPGSFCLWVLWADRSVPLGTVPIGTLLARPALTPSLLSCPMFAATFPSPQNRRPVLDTGLGFNRRQEAGPRVKHGATEWERWRSGKTDGLGCGHRWFLNTGNHQPPSSKSSRSSCEINWPNISAHTTLPP